MYKLTLFGFTYIIVMEKFIYPFMLMNLTGVFINHTFNLKLVMLNQLKKYFKIKEFKNSIQKTTLDGIKIIVPQIFTTLELWLFYLLHSGSLRLGFVHCLLLRLTSQVLKQNHSSLMKRTIIG